MKSRRPAADAAPAATVRLAPGLMLRLAARDETRVAGDRHRRRYRIRVRHPPCRAQPALGRGGGPLPRLRRRRRPPHGGNRKDLPALGRAGRGEHRARSFAEYWTEEQPLIAGARDLEEFNRAVDQLRDDAARLEKRIERLLTPTSACPEPVEGASPRTLRAPFAGARTEPSPARGRKERAYALESSYAFVPAAENPQRQHPLRARRVLLGHERVRGLRAADQRGSSSGARSMSRARCGCAARSRRWGRSSSSSARCSPRAATCCRPTSRTSWRSSRTRCRRSPPSSVTAILERVYGKPGRRRCSGSSTREPVASASVAQVHLARLPDGTEVAVKVLRPGIAARDRGRPRAAPCRAPR